MADLIDRKKAIELIWAHVRAMEAGIAVMWLETLPAELSWTPCNERLPDIYGDGTIAYKYLCTVMRSSKTTGRKGLLVKPVMFGIDGWIATGLQNDEGIEEEVIAWMPWPQPWNNDYCYMEERENESTNM